MNPLFFGCIPALSLDTAHSDLGEHLLAVYSGWKLLDNYDTCASVFVVHRFTDEASFTRDGINNLRNVHTWAHRNPHATCVIHFQRRYSLNVWCGMLGKRLIGPFVFDNNLTGNI